MNMNGTDTSRDKWNNFMTLEFFNLISTGVSLFLILCGIVLGLGSIVDCDNVLGFMVISSGVFFFIVAFTSVIAYEERLNSLLLVHIVLLFLLIVFVVCTTVFAFAVSSHKVKVSAGEVIGNTPHGSSNGFNLFAGNYSDWLKNRIANTHNWNRIKSCLKHNNFCPYFYRTDPLYYDTMDKMQGGCCKPPPDCWNFIHENSTTNDQRLNPDCNEWSFDPKSLCFDCQACKAGVLRYLKAKWRFLASWYIVFIVYLIGFFLVSCRAFVVDIYQASTLPDHA